MKNILSSLIIAMLLFSMGCKETKTEKIKEKEWYKGNLHTHSFWSDGDEFPEIILDWYKSNNYHFIALSDHNTISMEEKWIQVRSDTLYQNSFKNYLDTYGEEWVEHKQDSKKIMVKLKTYTEYSNHFEKAGEFLVIHSEEITDRYEDKHIHMNATNIQEQIEPQGGNSVAETMQNNLDQVLKQRKETGIPIMPHINHPNFFYSITLEDMISLKGEQFFEVYNGHPMVHNMGDSTHISMEKMWDLINIAYIKSGKPLMYGLATDDSHNYHKMGHKWSNAGRGWVMVQADTLSAPSLIRAMEKGDFYATTGVTLATLDYQPEHISIAVDTEVGVSYTISFIGCFKGETETRELMSVSASEARYDLSKDLLFVRAKITSDKPQKNPIENMKFQVAWTQPLLMGH
ncbi:hypothetical protein KCTC52924_01461 [Arenibacter antarcticus]|uniref:PHP domain-containing protein n=1 Tax=Arenibacter antarcticus TaxID=2040469 RepID=A0ABW5V9W4_9FLAO|nr:histidinol-phosphatase [Arenibacter sp. H213]MCM4167736.1 histidinol-phosphatase [Arenibacter sp. H213]